MIARTARATALTVLMLASAHASAYAEKFTERIERRFDVTADVGIHLANTNGSVSVEVWNETAVELIAEKRVDARSATSAQEIFDEIEIVVDESTGSLVIETEQPSGISNLFGWLFGRSTHSASVRYELRVPREADLTIRTVNGSVNTRGGGGDQSLRSTNGRIDVEGALRTVSAHTTNGSVTVGLAAGADAPEVEIGTTNGSIALHVPPTARGRLEARTVNGTVRTDLPVTLQGNQSKRRIDGDLNGGGASRLVLRTTNGSIRILGSDDA